MDLSPDDRQAFERVARILNKPLAQIYEDNQQHTNVRQNGTVLDPRQEEDAMYAGQQTWLPTTQWQENGWQPDFGGGGMHNLHTNGLSAPSSGSMFEEENGDSLFQWPEHTSQGPVAQTGGGGNTTPDGSNNWSFSVPTEFLPRVDHEDRMIGDIGPRSSSTGVTQAIKASTSLSRDDRLTSNGTFPRQDQDAIDGPSTPSRALFDSEVIEPGWVDVKPSQDSGYGSQPTSSEDAATSEWSMIESTKTHNSFLLDNPNLKSVKWVSPDSTGKELSPRKKRGPFQDQHLREETSDTRKLKACVRCRMQKIRCCPNPNDPSGICQTCQDVSKQKIHTLPCMRYKLTECTLYRTGKAPGMEFTFRWPVMKLRDISDWAAPEIRTIKVMSDVCSIPLELSVRKFVPIPQDRLMKSWVDGKITKYKETTPYAIVNMSVAAKDMHEYINNHVFKAMEYWLNGKDAWVQETFNFARKYMTYAPPEEGAVLADFFRLWFAVRRTATTEYIDGDDTLDMEPVTDRSYPLFGKVPLPPVMIQQLDMVLTIGFLQPLRKKVLENFQKIVLNNKPKSWMTIYLITFMSLYSCARLTAENYNNARKHGLKRRFAFPMFISERHHSANVFLSHYHYCTKPCNPFNLDWKRRQATPFAEMTTDEIDFILSTTEMVKERKARFRRTWENELYEDDFFFVSQMFEDEWMPRDTDIEYNDETISGVPLPRHV